MIKTLYQCPNLMTTIAKIYLQEWNWHFANEYNIHTLEEMIKDINDNFLHDTYVLFNNNEFIGTIALLEEDLQSHKHLKPWITCLYIEPKYRNQGYAKELIKHVLEKQNLVYLWCYNEKEKQIYEKWGAKLLEEFKYLDKQAYIFSYNKCCTLSK